MKLPVFENNKEKYTLKITNEVREIQNTNLCELLVFDHPEGIDVLVDKKGEFHTISNIVPPLSASNLQGQNFLDLVRSKDTLSYFGQNVPNGNIKDGIVMEFPKPIDSNIAKVIIRAKNTFFLDYMMGKFHELFGDAYYKWQNKQKNEPEEKLRKWSLDQNIPMSLYIERNGEWKFVDYYHIAGPMALKDDILAIPINQSDRNLLKIKLEWGANFWELDYVAADFTNSTEVKSYKLPLTSALTNKNKDIKDKLLEDDKEYYTQPNIGDEAVLTFKLPSPGINKRSIVLHTKGYYQILREPSGKPNVTYLKSFSQPGQFNKFCNEYIESIQKGISSQ